MIGQPRPVAERLRSVEPAHLNTAAGRANRLRNAPRLIEDDTLSGGFRSSGRGEKRLCQTDGPPNKTSRRGTARRCPSIQSFPTGLSFDAPPTIKIRILPWQVA